VLGVARLGEEFEVVTSSGERTEEVAASGETDRSGWEIWFWPGNDEVDAGREQVDVFDAEANVTGWWAVFANAEQAIETEEGGTPVASVSEAEEVNGIDEPSKVGEWEREGGIDVIELTEDVAKAAGDARVESWALEWAETRGGVPPLKRGDVGGKRVDWTLRAEEDCGFTETSLGDGNWRVATGGWAEGVIMTEEGRVSFACSNPQRQSTEHIDEGVDGEAALSWIQQLHTTETHRGAGGVSCRDRASAAVLSVPAMCRAENTMLKSVATE
jgi:hypothetical protein